jgi:hypothetical protein
MTFLAGYDHSTKSVLVILLTQENNLFTKICAVPVYWNILEYVGIYWNMLDMMVPV